MRGPRLYAKRLKSEGWLLEKNRPRPRGHGNSVASYALSFRVAPSPVSRVTSWDSELRRLRLRIPLALLLGPPGYLKHESDWAVERRRHGAVFLHFLLQPQ